MKYTLETNKYRIVLLASQRAKQLQNGARPRVVSANVKSTRVALTEIQQGLIGFHLNSDKKTKG